MQSVRAAIEAGNLIAPAGASARDLLDEENDWAEENEQLTGDLLTELENEARSEIEAGRLQNAERLLAGAVEISGDEAGYDALREELEFAYVAAESADVKGMSALTPVEMSAARYPRRAEEMGVVGWVDVIFTVSPDGTTTDIEVLEGQPAEVFDRAAVRAVERWRFEPVEFRGQIISQRAGARLKFELQ